MKAYANRRNSYRYQIEVSRRPIIVLKISVTLLTVACNTRASDENEIFFSINKNK